MCSLSMKMPSLCHRGDDPSGRSNGNWEFACRSLLRAARAPRHQADLPFTRVVRLGTQKCRRRPRHTCKIKEGIPSWKSKDLADDMT